MRAFTLDPSNSSDLATAPGSFLAEEVTIAGRRAFHKGHLVSPEDLAQLQHVSHPLHVIRLSEHDVHEDEAGGRLAAAVAGPGIAVGEPRQSRVNLTAATKGLLRIDAAALTNLNMEPGVSVFSLFDRLPVVQGRVVAEAKITPMAIDRTTLERAEAIGAQSPIFTVKPFLPVKVGIVTTEKMTDGVRNRFQANLTKKLAWYGAAPLGFAELNDDPDTVARAIEQFVADGAGLILTGGGNTIDPLDAALLALPMIGAEMTQFGAPVHPGSMFWLAHRGETPIFNLASCSMYSGATSADLILPWVMAGEHVTTEDMAGLGLGGLLEGVDMSFRFPPYDE